MLCFLLCHYEPDVLDTMFCLPCQCVIPSSGSIVMVRTFKHIRVSSSKEPAYAFDVRFVTQNDSYVQLLATSIFSRTRPGNSTSF